MCSQANPFASRFTRPGALEFVPSPTASVDLAIERLADADWRGQIVGPHGSGKSTLLAHLLPQLRERLPEVAHRVVRPDQCWNGGDLPRLREALVVIDGYDRLAWLTRGSLRRRHPRLLVCTHRSMSLPTIATTAPVPALAELLLGRLLESPEPELRAACAASYNRHNGNLREVWFDLYDHYELRQRQVADLAK